MKKRTLVQKKSRKRQILKILEDSVTSLVEVEPGFVETKKRYERGSRK